MLAGLLCAGCRDEPWLTVELSTNASFRDAFLLDSEHGWIVGGGPGIEGGIAGETRDGGSTWTFNPDVARRVGR